MWTTILSVSASLLRHIAEPAGRSLVLACFAGLALGALRVKSVSLKTAVWRVVLVAALLMPLAGVLAPPVRVPVPLPKFENRQTAREALVSRPIATREIRTPTVSADGDAPVDSLNLAPSEEASVTPVRHSRPIAWPLILAVVYFAVAILLLGRVLVGAALANRLAGGATPIRDSAALRELAASSRASGLRSPPVVAEAESLAVPVTLRIRNAAVLLPPTWREWEEGKLTAVLAHEVSHVARHDAFVQRLALIHRAVFWPSPLAWWLERHLADLAEQASDEAALAGGVDRAHYAETLLGFFAALESMRSRVWWQGVSIAKGGQAEKRVDRILAWRGAMPNKLKKSLVVAVAVFAAPVVALTASMHPLFFDFPQSPATAQAPAAPSSATPVAVPAPAPESAAIAPIAPSSPSVPATAPIAPSSPRVPAIAPTAPEPPVPAAAPLTPPAAWDSDAPAIAALASGEEMDRAREEILEARQALRAARKQVAAAKAKLATPATQQQLQSVRAAVSAYSRAMTSYKEAIREYRSTADEQATGGVSGGVTGGEAGGVNGGVYTDSGPRFVIVTKDSNSLTMSGSEEDAEHAKSLRSKIPGDFIWFERDEKSYVIRDQATVDRAKKLWEPERELGRKQEALGKQQEALGEQQEALGRKMEQVHVKIPDLSSQMEKLEAEMKQLSANGGTVEQIGDLQSQIGDLQSRIGEIQSDAGRQQGDIGRDQGELGRKQGELGRQQGELGRQQGELARQASREMKTLLDDAIAHGLAQPE
jgi:beta-lactamase regulating signal transducer with metallopeptidase domain